MMFISGRVAKLVRNSSGQLNRLLLEDGWEVRFSEELGNQLACVVSEGCAVTIEGVPRFNEFTDGYIYASLITNSGTGQSASLPALKRKGKPGMQARTTPAETASLAPSKAQARVAGQEEPVRPGENCNSLDDQTRGEAGLRNVDTESAETVKDEDEQSTRGTSEAGSSDEGGRQPVEWRPQGEPVDPQQGEQDSPLHPGSFFRFLGGEDDPSGDHGERNDAARSIAVAYDSLHRLQAILAYLHIMKYRVPGIGQFLDEAKHTYVQSLSRFAASDYSGAKEFAEASESLARVVEIVMGRTLRSDSTLPSLVPPPPKHLGPAPEPQHVEEDLAHAESVLARIHWVLEHGTLPSEDRAQVRKIASWGDAFYKQAQYTYRNAVLEDASEFAQAALAGAYSAEHVCRKWYLNHPGRH
jgi:hypothetical protein